MIAMTFLFAQISKWEALTDVATFGDAFIQEVRWNTILKPFLMCCYPAILDMKVQGTGSWTPVKCWELPTLVHCTSPGMRGTSLRCSIAKKSPEMCAASNQRTAALDCSAPLSLRHKTPMFSSRQNSGDWTQGRQSGTALKLQVVSLKIYEHMMIFWWFLMVGLAILGCCKHGPNSLHQSEGLQACCFLVSRFLCAALVDLSPGWTEKRRLCWPLEVGTTSFVKSHFRYLVDEVVSKMEQNSLSSLWNLPKPCAQWETVLTFRPIRFRGSRFISPFARARLHYCLGSSQSLSVQQPFSNQTTEKTTSMLRFGEARDAHGVTWRQFPFSFYQQNHPMGRLDYRMFDTVVTFIFPRLEHLAKFKSIVLTLDIYFRMLPWQNSKGFGSEQSDGHIVVVICRHWMMAMRGLQMSMSWPQNRIATKVVSRGPADDFARSLQVGNWGFRHLPVRLTT